MSGRTTVRIATMVVSALGAGLVVGCGSDAPGTPEEIAQGQELFKLTCASCHGPNAEGMPKLGKNLHENEFVQSLDEAELAAFFKQGRPAFHPDNERKVDMPPRGGNPTLTDDDLRLIAVYVKSIQ